MSSSVLFVERQCVIFSSLKAVDDDDYDNDDNVIQTFFSSYFDWICHLSFGIL